MFARKYAPSTVFQIQTFRIVDKTLCLRLNDVRFAARLYDSQGEFVVVTTRPESLLGDTDVSTANRNMYTCLCNRYVVAVP